MLGRSQQASGPTMVNVRVAGRTFEVDLELLKKHSCYFAKCFHKLPQDALRIPLELQDVKPEVFEALVLFMETGFLDADPFTALDIYEAAMLLGVHRAVKEIKRITLIGSKMERLLVWYRTANKGSSGRERQAALRLVASRFDEVVADERFLRLSVAEVVPLFSCSRLGTSGELSVFVAALRWLNHDYSKRQQYVVQLLKCVRFSLMSREEIVHCFHPPLLSNITRFPSVAFMVLSAFGVVCLQEEGREHLLSRFASQPRTYLCPKQDGQPQLWPLPAPPEGSVAQRRHRAATVLQTWWRVHKARLDLAARRREKLLATGAVDEPQSGALRAWPSDDGAANWLHGTIEAAKSNESVDSDTSAKTSKEPFTPILKVVIKDAESSAKQSAADAGFPALHRSEASLLKLVPPPPPKKEDKVRTPEKAPQAPTTQSSEVFSVNWDEGNVAELGEEPLPAQGAQLPQLLQPQLLQPQRLTPPQAQRPVGATSATIPTTTATTTPAFTAQVLGDLMGTPTLPRATRNFEFSKHAEQGQLKAPFPCDFDREFDMKSFVETVSCAGEVAGIRGRSPSTRTARPRTPPERNSSPTSYRTVQTRSEAAWGFPDEFESKSHGRFWKYDTKSTFTNIYGSFESLDPFSRPHHGNFSLPPSMVKRMGKAEVVTAIEQPSILVTGGLNLDTGISASVVAFDPSFSTLQQCGVLPTPLHHHRTVLVGSDVIVVGGMLESAEGPYVCSRRCYRLNTVTMQWSRVADLKTERAHHGLVYFDGRILAIGGLTLGRKLVSSMEYYDVKRNKWTKMKASLPQPTMAMGVALFRSLVWVAGGVVGSSEDDIACCAAVHCYDPKAKTWTSTAPSLPKPCAYLSLVCAPDGLLSVGGSVSLDQLQAGSVADVWRLTGDQRAWEPLVPLPRPCHSSGAVVFGEAVYVFGGISDSHVLADVLLLQKGRWTLCAHLQASVLGPSVVALPVPGSRCEGAGGGDIANNLAERTGRKDDDLIMWSWHNL